MAKGEEEVKKQTNSIDVNTLIVRAILSFLILLDIYTIHTSVEVWVFNKIKFTHKILNMYIQRNIEHMRLLHLLVFHVATHHIKVFHNL